MMLAQSSGRTFDEPGPTRSGALAAALVLSSIFWLLAWYLGTGQAIVSIWLRSDTFVHGILVVPISAWLIWLRRDALAVLDLRPNFFVLLLVALAGFGWLLGHLAAAGVVQQFGLVIMIPLLVWTVLGTRAAKEIAFPLCFLLLAVPFGEFLEPIMMEYTADFTVFAIRLSGIPIYREGQFFALPSGNWSVVEACSGLRYLIASVTLGLLYAYLTYRSFSRRAIFVVVSFIVPIVANWLRAYMVVMIGHLSGMKYAVGVDHLIYGWVFFGVVILILFWIGSHWREDLDPPMAQPQSTAPALAHNASLWPILAATVAAAAVVALWPLYASRMEDAGSNPLPAVQAPPASRGWQAIDSPFTSWTPRFASPRAQITQTYGEGARRVGLYVGYYRNQSQGTPLISSQNVLVHSGDREWANSGETERALVFNDEKIALIEAQLRGGTTRLLVWRWYWVDGQFTLNPYWAKLLQAKSQLFGRGDDGAVVIAYTTLDADREAARASLQAFVDAMLPGIVKGLDHARRVKPGA